MFTENRKRQVIKAAKDYLKAKGVSQNELARITGVLPSYMSDLMNGRLTTGTKNTPIKDHYFADIALAIGYELGNGLWWHIDTANYKRIANALADARSEKLAGAVDGGTGMGKSHAIRQLAIDRPSNTYVVKCAGDQTAKSFIQSVAEALDIKEPGSQYQLRRAISKKLAQESGSQLIVDEAENLKVKAYDSIKAIMDDVEGKSSVVLIGANHYQATIIRLADRSKTPFPQINRRISQGGWTTLFEWTKEDTLQVCHEHNIRDADVIRLLYVRCKNMGELKGAITRLKKEMLGNPGKDIKQLSRLLLAS